MSLLTHQPVKFGDLVECTCLMGHYLVVGWLDGDKTQAVCENSQGGTVYVTLDLLRVAKPARVWKDRPREQRTSR